MEKRIITTEKPENAIEKTPATPTNAKVLLDALPNSLLI
jgi:hypothetical protein